jgi:hypothetical protein
VDSPRRIWSFAALVAVSVIVVAIVLMDAAGRGDVGHGASPSLVAAGDAPARLVFRNLDSRDAGANGRVAIAALDQARTRTLTPLRCDRVYFRAASGLCIARGSGYAAGYRTEVFDPRFKVRFAVDVPGIPSRARVSPDGRYGSVTMFVQGHSYAESGAFSTQTTLIDLKRGLKIANLEQFAITRNGRRVTADDVNFWGVTFARDSDRFYATLATGGKTYLVRGSISERSARTIHENVECPSLSPDGTRIGYKKRVGGKQVWRPYVLDLATMHETPLAETRGVDDQVEWLDDERLSYGIDGSIWAVRADGSGAPAQLTANGESPAAL